MTSAGSANIELDRILRTAEGTLSVEFSAGERKWQVELSGRQLSPFSTFRAAVADSLGIWVEHDSQGERRAHDRAQEWEHAVAGAFDRRAKKS
jgi:hypothetical protein